MRPNRVHPLWRTDHDNNVGIGAPRSNTASSRTVEWIDLITVHKGGLFGTDYRMLFPSDGIQGSSGSFLDSLVAFGKRGLACQPAIIGIGLGGCKDTCMVLGKRAACLRTVGDGNPDPEDRRAGTGIDRLGNSIGMGAMGFVGKSMVIDTHIEVGYCHTGGMQMSCMPFACRRGALLRAFMPTAGGTTAPTLNGSPPYQRRETVEWPKARNPREIRLSTSPTAGSSGELRAR